MRSHVGGQAWTRPLGHGRQVRVFGRRRRWVFIQLKADLAFRLPVPSRFAAMVAADNGMICVTERLSRLRPPASVLLARGGHIM
jgi:hypothetical protein